jgi:hypothetical protein
MLEKGVEEVVFEGCAVQPDDFVVTTRRAGGARLGGALRPGGE